MLFPFRKSQSEVQLLDLLMDHADALIAGSLNRDQLFDQYDQVSRSQIDNLLNLAERVSSTLITVNPSDEFVKQLYFDLIEAALNNHPSLWQRIRQMPPRRQLAAGIGGATLTAGVVFIASRPAREFWRNRRATA
jgi:hypothetical protein